MGFISSFCSCYHWSEALVVGTMERHARFGLVAFLAVIVLCLPAFSECGRVVGLTRASTEAAESAYYSKAFTEYCPTDFSKVSYDDVKSACPANAGQGATAACCAAFNAKACQYEAQVNNFGSMCPMLFINYLGVAGPYPAGYFVGPCVDGTKGFCIRK